MTHRLLKELAIDTGMEKKMISTIDDLLKYGFTEGQHFHALVAKCEKSIGLCLYFYTFSSWMGAPGIFIQDLFVAKKYRKLDIGKNCFMKWSLKTSNKKLHMYCLM